MTTLPPYREIIEDLRDTVVPKVQIIDQEFGKYANDFTEFFLGLTEEELGSLDELYLQVACLVGSRFMLNLDEFLRIVFEIAEARILSDHVPEDPETFERQTLQGVSRILSECGLEPSPQSLNVLSKIRTR